MVLNKIDLLPYVPFNSNAAVENVRRVHPEIDVMKVSCITGEGLDSWMNWIENRRTSAVSIPTESVVQT
jgi:hydrogenase nickel incorporation protein HypB